MQCFAATIMLCVTASAWAEAPQRIVSLDLCTDWMLALHAKREQIAAISPRLRRAAIAQTSAAESWPAHDGTLESIMSLQPDLVMSGEFNSLPLRRRLAALGVRVEALPFPQTLQDIVAYEQRLLALIGKTGVPAGMPAPAPAHDGSAPRLLLLGANGIGTGAGTMENEVLRAAGWRNYTEAQGYVKLDLERIVADPPDAILWAAPAHPALAYRFAQHPVLHHLSPPPRWLETDDWRWECPGPWTWGLIEQLRQWRP